MNKIILVRKLISYFIKYKIFEKFKIGFLKHMNTIPTILENNGNEKFVYDLYSKLLKDRIIFLSGPIDESVAKLVIAEMLYPNTHTLLRLLLGPISVSGVSKTKYMQVTSVRDKTTQRQQTGPDQTRPWA